jgi:hypothetical protein
MALDFTGGDSDVVNHGSDTSLDDLQTWTKIFWVSQDSWSGYRHLFQKNAGVSNQDKQIEVNGDSGNGSVRAVIRRSGPNDTLEVSSFFASLSTWYFVVITYDAAASSGQRITLFRGTLTSTVSQTNQGGTGTGTVVDASADLHVGNGYSGSASIDGKVAFFGHWNKVLTIGEIKAQQFRPHVTSGCVVFSHYAQSQAQRLQRMCQ